MAKALQGLRSVATNFERTVTGTNAILHGDSHCSSVCELCFVLYLLTLFILCLCQDFGATNCHDFGTAKPVNELRVLAQLLEPQSLGASVVLLPISVNQRGSVRHGNAILDFAHNLGTLCVDLYSTVPLYSELNSDLPGFKFPMGLVLSLLSGVICTSLTETVSY